MEKLSSILPGSARVKSVDMRDAKPRRPGAPSFGAPEGRNTVQDRVTLSQAAATAAGETIRDKVMDKPNYTAKEFQSAKSVDDVTNNFFETRLLPAAQEIAEQVPMSQDVTDTIAEDLKPG